MKKIISILCFLAFLVSNFTYAQSDNKQFINASIGFGLSSPYDDVETFGKGLFVQGEYVYQLYTWLDLRPYAGLILATTEEKDNAPNETGFRSDANAFLLGGKVRLKAPIPWVSPYIEIGVGMSAGEFETITATTNIKENGMLFHIPVSIGLELGRKHNFDIGLTYYFHNSAEQFATGVAFGVTFPLN